MSKSKRRDIDGIFGILNEEKDKIKNSGHLLQLKRRKLSREEKWRCRVRFCDFFRERERAPSL